MNLFYKMLVILGCTSLICAGILVSIKTKSYGLGLANIFVGVANLIFMLR